MLSNLFRSLGGLSHPKTAKTEKLGKLSLRVLEEKADMVQTQRETVTPLTFEVF
tara:strand:- start:2268 stop:2429 length:162 start_codon:yes stop_codon:yes gene_type:complete